MLCDGSFSARCCSSLFTRCGISPSSRSSLPCCFRRVSRRRGGSTLLPGKPLLLITAAAALLIVGRALVPIRLPENESNPWKLIAAVPQPLRSQPVLNGYSMGGPLILSGIRPFIDGRADMYGDAFVADYARLSSDPALLAAAVRRWNLRWAILPHDNRVLIGLLERSGEWRKVASDSAGVVYVRAASAS